MKVKKFLKKCRKWLIAVVFLGIIGAVVVSFAGRAKRTGKVPDEVPAQETAEVERRSLMETVSATGKVVSAEDKSVTVSLSGVKVKEVKVGVGDSVKAGDVICLFDIADLEEDLADAKTTLNAAEGKSAVDVAGAQRGLSEAQVSGEIEIARANADADEAYNDYLRAQTDVEEAEDDYIEAQEATAIKNGEWEAAKRRMEELEDDMEEAEEEAKKLSSAAGKVSEYTSEFANTVNELASIIPAEQKEKDIKSFLYIENKELDSFAASDFVKTDADESLKTQVETYLGTLKGLQTSYLAAKKDQTAYEAANAVYQAAQADYQEAQQEASSWESKYNSAKNSESSYENALDQAISNSDSKYDTYEQQVRNKEDAVRNSASTVSGKEDTLTNSQLNASTSSLSDKQQIRSLEEQIEACTVKAPIDGVVTSLNVAEGDTFSGTNNAAVAVIEDVSNYEVEAEIDEYDIVKIKEGQSVVIKTNATGDLELDGQVKEIAPRASSEDGSSSSVTYKVTVSIDTPCEELRMDMTAKLSIVIESREDVLTVPYDAVQEAEDGSYYVELAQEQGNDGELPEGGGVHDGEQPVETDREQDMEKQTEARKDRPMPGNGLEGNAGAGERITVEKGIESDYYIEVISDEVVEGMKVIVPVSDDGGQDFRGMAGRQGPMGGF